MEHFTLMNNDLQKKRMFLFPQGPPWTFFFTAGMSLESYGHATNQISFNQGDKIFWANKRSFIPFTLPIHAWSGFLQREFREKQITDFEIYNATAHRSSKANEVLTKLQGWFAKPDPFWR